MALTKARESLARVRIGMNRTATEITRPDLFPSVSLAMKESPLPWYPAEAKAAPASTALMITQRAPGR